MCSVRTGRQDNRRLVIESAALGLGYATTLIWVGSAFVGSFGDFDDAYPYWPAIPKLRTDTAGFIALRHRHRLPRDQQVPGARTA